MIPALQRVWAIARMTLLEARRRKVFSILLLFTVALLSSALFFPSIEVEGRLRLIEVWSLRAAALFTAIVGLFLAGFSLPTDFEQKRIYLLVSKPASKSVVFLGRYLGYALLLALFIGTMGIVTTAFLRVVKSVSGERFPALVAYPRLAPESFEHPGGDEVRGGKVTGAIDARRQGVLRWAWSGLRRAQFPDGESRMQLRLVFGSLDPEDKFRAAGTVHAKLVGEGGRSQDLTLSMNTNEERELKFRSDLIGASGELALEVRCGDADGVIAGAVEGAWLYEKSMSFELAFARGLGLVLLQSLIVLSITLMGSTFLSAPVSILLGILLYIVGSVHGYVRDGSQDIDRSLVEIKESATPKRSPEDLPVSLLLFSTTLTKGVLLIVPDFAHFDFSVWLLRDQAVSWKELGEAAAKALPPILVMVLLGTLIMIFKDFDR